MVLHTGPGEPLAWVVRGHLAESVHTGHLLVSEGDRDLVTVGDLDAPTYARSSLKPIQAVALLRTGAQLTDAQLALSCGSHAGTPLHLEVALSMLASVGLGPDALQNTPDWPLDSQARSAVVREGGEPSSLMQNCSGKHAGMLAACVAAGWDTASYREIGHPLQQLIGSTLAEMTGVEPMDVSLDGCGAPLFGSTLRGIARAFAAIADAQPDSHEHRVARAMRARPELVGGDHVVDTRAMRDIPDLIVKGGAEGFLAAALPGGRTIVAKVADGNARPVPVLLAAGLRVLGIEGRWAWEQVPVLGHGSRVGSVIPAFGS